MRAAAGRFGLNLLILEVTGSEGLETAFTALDHQLAGGLIAGGAGLFLASSR
jgi:hypothetical protein